VAIGAEFSRHSRSWRDLAHAYARRSFRASRGATVSWPAMRVTVRPTHFKRTYLEDPGARSRWALRAAANPTALRPLPARGISSACRTHRAASPTGDATFYFLGADKYG